MPGDAIALQGARCTIYVLPEVQDRRGRPRAYYEAPNGVEADWLPPEAIPLLAGVGLTCRPWPQELTAAWADPALSGEYRREEPGLRRATLGGEAAETDSSRPV